MKKLKRTYDLDDMLKEDMHGPIIMKGEEKIKKKIMRKDIGRKRKQ